MVVEKTETVQAQEHRNPTVAVEYSRRRATFVLQERVWLGGHLALTMHDNYYCTRATVVRVLFEPLLLLV